MFIISFWCSPDFLKIRVLVRLLCNVHVNIFSSYTHRHTSPRMLFQNVIIKYKRKRKYVKLISLIRNSGARETRPMLELKYAIYVPVTIVLIFILAIIYEVFTVLCRWLKTNRASSPTNQENVWRMKMKDSDDNKETRTDYIQ